MERLGRRGDAEPGWAAPRLHSGRDEAAAAEGGWRLGAGTVLQRKGKEGMQDEEEHRLLRKAEPGGGREPRAVPAIVGEMRGSGLGRPLDPWTRAYFEPHLGQPLADVRVHVGSTASASARAVGARAYTVGSDIVFQDGAFTPQARSGKELLAHELAHVAQQAAGTAPVGKAVTPADHDSEREADGFAATVTEDASAATEPTHAATPPKTMS